ncbi:AAA family ATPase [Dactylosporangium matsuzakiense]|uniref:AAA family ATPase n=1 Tax=Dactylosporangium matsuzakiense TaxID=53360 RepID=A0A9W6KHC0_9ACTN|nr:AAA family ATPase [Dactylosporangium matsuzakiense]UWZ48296.1 AAA family ATPase [Dactylosporangium matsuzakiense]GLL01538.1 hypothetical protein GCM10017581_032790 [Dactylosporangium matsuzakiense]
MPLLGPLDPLPYRPRRIIVAGPSGAGKTTLARRISAVLGIVHVEIDGLYHGAGWVPRPEFLEDVYRFTAAPQWVAEWQYSAVRGHLAQRAELLVWLDLPRYRVMRQLVRRTVRRRVRREVLWNGNVEPGLWTVVTDPEHVLRWSWTSHHRTPMRVRELLERRADLPVVRLRSHTESRRWLGGPLREARGTAPAQG